MNTVEQRLNDLERSVRRYRVTTWALVLAFVVGATVAASGDGVKDVVRARMCRSSSELTLGCAGSKFIVIDDRSE